MVAVTESKIPYQITSISYAVPSAIEAGVTYIVTVTDAGTTCTCKAGTYSRPCGHVKAVRAGAITSKPRVRIRPLEATVVTAVPAPSGNPGSFLWDPDV